MIFKACPAIATYVLLLFSNLNKTRKKAPFHPFGNLTITAVLEANNETSSLNFKVLLKVENTLVQIEVVKFG